MSLIQSRALYALLSLLILILPLQALNQDWITLPHWIGQNINRLPYIIFTLGLVLCWVFYNSREFNLLLILGASYWSCENYLWAGSLPVSQKELLFDLLSILIPLNFVIYNFCKERGILNQYGIKRLTPVVLQIGLVYWLVSTNAVEISMILNIQFYKLHNTAINQPALIIMVFSLFILLSHWVIQGNQLRYAWVLTLCSIILVLHYVYDPLISTSYFILAGIIIIVAIVIHSYNLAYKDELTQLPSRRALRQHLMSLGKNYAIAMVDVDHFKKLNDTYGHDIGDEILKKLAVHLSQVEGGGKAYRYGGEEFTLIFPGKDAKTAAIYLDALRVKIDTSPFTIRHKKRPSKKPDNPAIVKNIKQLNVTVSIGVASNQADHLTPQDVTKLADNALYKAKKNGRNQIAINRRQ